MDEWFATTDIYISLLVLQAPYSLSLSVAVTFRVQLFVSLTSTMLSRDYRSVIPEHIMAQAQSNQRDRCELM